MNNINIGVIGLGYVGLPLAIEFGKKYPTTGFDINKKRVGELQIGNDKTNEITTEELHLSSYLKVSDNLSDIHSCNIYIITVPTPIDEFKTPDLNPLKKATEAIGSVLKKQDIVVYESTVYPGCTEEFCVPILEEKSGLKFNIDFFCGYSPERIVPGDKKRTLVNIRKVTSGSTPEVALKINDLYQSILEVKTHLAPSIKVAEASKAIENAQRDLNISFVNELAIIFDRLNIDTRDVLDAAGTKWNFLKFSPGLVGGHCIGVDPYYLTHKAQSLGYHPEVVLSGRRVNENMGVFVANKFMKAMIQRNFTVSNSKVLLLGITFKENCSDIRNTKITQVYSELTDFGVEVDVYDPVADSEEVSKELGIQLIQNIENRYEGIILAVGHTEFETLDIERLKESESSIIFDLKGFLPREAVTIRL